jgi:hypothetical protein
MVVREVMPNRVQGDDHDLQLLLDAVIDWEIIVDDARRTIDADVLHFRWAVSQLSVAVMNLDREQAARSGDC